MKKSIFSLVAATSSLMLFGAFCQSTTDVNTNTAVNTNIAVNANVRVNTNTTVSVNTNVAVNANTNSVTNTNTTTNTISRKTVTITYSGSSFSPSSVTVNAGDILHFVNTSSSPLSVASNPHPTHTGNREIGSGPMVSAGGTYDLTLTGKGTFGYHNHLSPSVGGTLIVQ